MKDKRTRLTAYAMLLTAVFILTAVGLAIRSGPIESSPDQFYTLRGLGNQANINFLGKSSNDRAFPTLFKTLNETVRYTFDKRVELITEGQEPEIKNSVRAFVSILSGTDIPTMPEDISLSEDFSSTIECYVKTSHFPGG